MVCVHKKNLFSATYIQDSITVHIKNGLREHYEAKDGPNFIYRLPVPKKLCIELCVTISLSKNTIVFNYGKVATINTS